MATSALRIALAQLNYKLCDFETNVAKIRETVHAAEGADLIVFSELCLSGYYPMDMVEEPDFLARQGQALDAVLALSRETRAALVIGAVTRNAGVGKPLRNSLLVVRNGQAVLTYHKQLLPTYNIFDERRHFEPGENRAALLELKGRKIGFLICEDGWNDEEREYPVNPLRTVVEAGAELVISINASPSNVGKEQQRHELFAVAARRHRVPIVYVNQVGGNDQIVFDGASFVVDPCAGVVARLPSFEESVASFDFDGGFRAGASRCDSAVSDYLADEAFYYRQIVLGLRDYVAKIGFQGVVVGSSGGIDSALTIALAADALGPENVRAITMPSRYSSDGSVADSETLCSNLGVELHRHDIAGLFEGFRSGFAAAFGEGASGLTQENVQARIRGTILMEYSNHFGHLVLSTGNKSEMSVGYATLYGDMNGGLNLIGDLYKTEVFALANYYNRRHGRDLIPRAIIDKEPSAELAPDQRDTDSLPPYAVLDEILKLHIEGGRLRETEYARARAFVEELETTGQRALVRRVAGLVAKAEFKRRQAPPIIRVRGRAFGNGRQMPIAARY
jgi:NAD+ synthase (glutamine-hydrolysing)